MINWWRKSLAVQLLTSMLLALLVSQAIALAISWGAYLGVIHKTARTELNSRAAAVARLIELAPRSLQSDMATVNSTEYTRFWVSPGDTVGQREWLGEAFERFRLPLREFLMSAGEGKPVGSPTASTPLPEDATIELFYSDAQWSGPSADAGDTPAKAKYIDYANMQGAGVIVPLSDGRTLNAAYYKHLVPSVWNTQLPLNIAITAALVSLAGILTARRLVRPLVNLTQAAEKLGRGEPVTPLCECGPDDIQRTSIAFNTMQQRLRRFVEDRTRMLAAIGHDMRTPLTILRLRAELVPDLDLQSKMMTTIDEMEAMTEACLSLAKQETNLEPTRTIDLAALVESVCEDLVEMGSKVSVEPTSRIDYRCRPDALRRTIRNLIENAVRYGGHADVRLLSGRSGIEVTVEDEGPGIPIDKLEEVFAPFFRIENSRSRETGGVGLGLSIARAIARQHGGDIVLSLRQPGLRASLVLPL